MANIDAKKLAIKDVSVHIPESCPLPPGVQYDFDELQLGGFPTAIQCETDYMPVQERMICMNGKLNPEIPCSMFLLNSLIILYHKCEYDG